MLGVIFKIRAASTSWGALSPLPGSCICTPCFICAGWLSKENNFGFEIVLLIPSVSNASNWIFNTAEPVLLKTPIPLVAAPTAPDWNKPSLPEPIAAVPDEIAPPVPSVSPTVDPPIVPPTLSLFLVYAPPNFVPRALSQNLMLPQQ